MTSRTIRPALAALGLLALAACNDPSNDGIRTTPQSEPHVTYIYSQVATQPCSAPTGHGCRTFG